MMNDSELGANADPTLEQYFLVSPEKLSLLISAGGVRPEDQVVEVGAGAGTVARRIPNCRKLTLIEFDQRLIPTLQKNVPHANIIQADALTAVREIRFDVLFSNLPNCITEKLIDILPELNFRVAVLAVGESSNLARVATTFEVKEVTRISGEDFTPPQPSVSRIVQITRA